MRKFIVITTIQEPTEAVRAFARLKHWQLVVVGDKKTPAGWQCEKAVYLPPVAQKKYDFGLPWNNYCRKMIGYLYAMKAGATHIAESDDDNIPQENWGFPAHEGEFARYDSNLYDTATGAGFVNVYKYFTKDNIWPRGFPLDKIKRETPALRPLSEGFRVGVWQGLADNDPDVDAIYRLTSALPVLWLRRHGDPNRTAGGNANYQKPIIVKAGLGLWWGVGLHNYAENPRVRVASGRFDGAHWRMADPDLAVSRRLRGRRENVSAEDIENRWSYDNFDITESEIRAECAAHLNDPQLF